MWPRPNDEELPTLLQDHSFFWQYFVPGAPAYLDSNINTNLGLVNGALITLHSLTFENEADQQRVFELCNTQPDYGSELIIPLPTAVNVVVHTIDNTQTLSPRRAKQIEVLNEYSQQMGINRITANEVIIPLQQSAGSNKDQGPHSIYVSKWQYPFNSFRSHHQTTVSIRPSLCNDSPQSSRQNYTKSCCRYQTAPHPNMFHGLCCYFCYSIQGQAKRASAST